MHFRINWTLAENIISLLSVKGLQYLLSFITFPYLVRCLNVDGFGQLSFVIGVIQYFLLFSNFGFDLSAPKRIAQHDHSNECGYHFSSIMMAKTFILLILTCIFLLFVFVLKHIGSTNTLLYCAVYLNVIGTALFPIWFFQGIQKMRYITLVSTIGKVVSVVGIFTLVTGPEDILWAGLFQSSGNLVAAIFSWIIIFSEYRDVFVRVSWQDIKNAILESVPYFGSMVAINIYTISTTVFLGILTSDYWVGIYSSANRIIDALRGGLSPIIDSIYPHVNKVASQSKDAALKLLKKTFIAMVSLTALLSASVFVFSPFLIELVLGSGYEDAIIVLKILSVIPVITIASNIYGLFGMLAFGYEKQFGKVLIHSAVLDLCVVFPFIYLWQANGAALTMACIEAYVLFRFWHFVTNSDIRFI